MRQYQGPSQFTTFVGRDDAAKAACTLSGAVQRLIATVIVGSQEGNLQPTLISSALRFCNADPIFWYTFDNLIIEKTMQTARLLRSRNERKEL